MGFTETVYEREEDSGFPVLLVRGRIATRDVEGFEANLYELEADVEDCGIIDLSECAYITSRGFPLFVISQRTLRDQGKHLFLVVCPEVRELFQVLRLTTRLSLHDSREACVNAARAARGMRILR